ncbi:MAG: glycosyltransferase family 2 protein [Paludibacter sp.]|nr:glycosyltransferase family 2 protein [Paludibacter sp.]
MIYIAYFILAFTGLQLLVALLNFLFRTDYARYRSMSNELLSVIIPVRNEEKNIGNLLDDLSKQNYTNIEIIVINDDSTDNTRNIVLEKSATNNKIKLIDTRLTDCDWLGKNHACYLGATAANGKFLLFLDADVRLGKEVIKSLLGYLQKSRSVFLSVFPKQIILNKGVASVVPVMNHILLSLLPLFFVRYSRFSSMAAANGQLMLFDTEVYRAFEPHKKFRKEKVEDIHIARFLKKKKFRIACLTGNDDLCCKMYDNYEEAVEGFSKNVVAFFGDSYIAAILFWIISFGGVLLIVSALPFWWSFIYLVIIIVTRMFISITSRQNIRENILLHFVQLYNLGLLIIHSIKHRINKDYQWKGRIIT